MSPSELAHDARARAEDIRLVRFLYCDPAGVIRGKNVHVARLANRMREGIGLTRAQNTLDMLEQLSRHSLIDMEVRADGDLHIDQHHTVEDTGIALGQAVARALGERRGISRYASIDLVMDEAATRAAVDVSGRPFLVWKVAFSAAKIGDFDTELAREFFQAFAQHARLTLHVVQHYGDNNHHIAETCFKAVARALRTALALDPHTYQRAGSLVRPVCTGDI